MRRLIEISDYNKDFIETNIDGIVSFYGYRNRKFLDCGSYGCTYEVGDGKVLKITTDRDEALIANNLRKRRTKHLVNYYDIRHIKDTKYYALIMDRVHVLDDDIKDYYSEFLLSPGYEFLDKQLEIPELYSIYKQKDSILEEFNKYNIRFIEAHKNNVGFDDKGNFVFFDLGKYTAGKQKPLTLKGIFI